MSKHFRLERYSELKTLPVTSSSIFALGTQGVHRLPETVRANTQTVPSSGENDLHIGSNFPRRVRRVIGGSLTSNGQLLARQGYTVTPPRNLT